MRRLLTLLLLCALAGPSAGADRPHVYLVLVDGLDARMLDPDVLPVLWDRGRLPGRALAVMPTRTNPNHVTLLTGAWPDVHGITGNDWWDRDPAHGAAKLDRPELIDVETVFTVAETDQPELVTMGVFGKPKLGRLFAAAPGRQRAPDVLWTPAGSGPGIDPTTGYATDATTMGRLLEEAATREPDLAFVGLCDVDRQSHGAGPASREAREAAVAAGAQIQRLVDALRAAGRWERSLVIVTADHGFDDVAPRDGRTRDLNLGAVLTAASVHGVRVVADGGVAHVYAEGLPATAVAVGAAVRPLAQAATVARTTPGVWEVLARLPVPGVASLEEKHPDWHLANPRAGDLLVVAAPGHQFVEAGDPALRGNHGGPGERVVPYVVLGGHPAGAELRQLRDAPLPEVGRRVFGLLGLRAPRVLAAAAPASPPPAR